MAHIEERKTKDGKVHYRVMVRKRGFPLQTATFERKTDARKWAISTEAAIDERRFRNVAQAKRRTVAELIDRYIETVLPRKPKSATVQLPQLRWWRDQLGLMTLADLSADIIADQRDKLMKRDLAAGRRISPASVNRYLAAFSHVLSVAVREFKWLPDSPMRDVAKLPESQPRVRYLSAEERDALLNACKTSSNQYLFTVALLAISTGMRKNEIMRLAWTDVDLDRRVVLLLETKNKERRAVPLAGLAYEAVTALRSQRSNISNLLFPSTDPNKPVDIRKAWETAIAKAGIKDFRFHDLRHSAASYLAMSGASLPEIAAVLGHKSYAMVKRYAHLSDQHTASVVERMNKEVFGDGDT